LFAQQLLGLGKAQIAAGPAGASVGLRMGVIDTGLNAALLAPTAAPLLNGSQLQMRSVLASSDTPASPTHGTQVALLMASAPLANGFAGAAPAVHLFWASALRKVGDSDSTNSWLLAQAFEWLLAQQVQLINLSLGGAGDDILRAITARVLAKGVALLAAAGNKPDALPVYPGAYPGVWAVTAVDAASLPYRSATRGAYVSFAAPGVDVWVPELASLASAAPAGRYVSGSSYATALASAAMARLPAAFWQLSAQERKGRLCSTARAVPAAQGMASLGCGVLQFEMSEHAAASAKIP
jgi:hypothetical protein